MKRLILDYYRRWWWLLALVAVQEFVLGWSIAASTTDRFDFWVFALSMWEGPMLLILDLQRGVARAVLALPVRTGQVGRAWWLATVGLPAAAFAVILCLSTATFQVLYPDIAVPAIRLALAALFNLIWLGTGFFTFSGSHYYIVARGWKRVLANFLSWLCIGMFFGGLSFLQNASRQPDKCAVLLGVGGFLTLAGWFRAGAFIPERAGFRLAGLQVRGLQGQPRAQRGYGGIRLLISTTFVRSCLISLVAAAWMVLGSRIVLGQGASAYYGSVQFGGIVLCILLLFVPPELRFLRTLPISATRLAVVIVVLVILPLITVGALATVFTVLSLGIPDAIAVSTIYLFYVAVAPLGMCIAVSQGPNLQSYISLSFMLVVFQLVFTGQWGFGERSSPLTLTVPIVAACVLLAFLLTRRVLTHSSRVYRVRTKSLDGFRG